MLVIGVFCDNAMMNKQHLSLAWPDGTKVGPDLSIELGCILEPMSKRVRVAAPQVGIWGDQKIKLMALICFYLGLETNLGFIWVSWEATSLLYSEIFGDTPKETPVMAQGRNQVPQNYFCRVAAGRLGPLLV